MLYNGWTPTPELNIVKYRQTLCELIVLQPNNQYWSNLLDAVDAEYHPADIAWQMALEEEREHQEWQEEQRELRQF